MQAGQVHRAADDSAAELNSGGNRAGDSRRGELLGLLALSLILAVVAVIRYRFLETPLERDEGEFAYGGQLILAGETPYTAMYAMKLPGIYLAYALIEALCGQSIRAIHLGLLLVNLASISLIYLLGRNLLEAATGVMAAAAFALLTLSPTVLGTQAQSEHFVVLAGLSGILLLHWAQTRRNLVLYLASGVALGTALLVKQHGFVFPLFGLVCLAAAEPQRWRDAPRRLVVELLCLTGGCLMPCLLVGALFAWIGALGPFIFWTVTYPTEYVSMVPPSIQLAQAVASTTNQLKTVGALWATAAVGVSALFWYRPARRWRSWLLLLLAAGVLGVMPGGYYRQHYYLLLAPALALLTAVGLRGLGAEYRATGGGRVMPWLLVLMAFAWPTWRLASFYGPLTATTLSRELYGGCPFPEAIVLGRFLAHNSTANDSVGVLGSEPEIFFYAQRRSATGHIYMYPLTEPHPYALQLQQQVVDDLEAARPKFILEVLHPSSWLANRGGNTELFGRQVQTILAKQYRQIGIVETLSKDQTTYLWGSQMDDARHDAQRRIVIHQRCD